MSQPNTSSTDRIDELLADQALYGLSPAETDELRRLLHLHPERDNDHTELAASAAHLAIIGRTSSVTMPHALRAKVIAQSAEWTGPRIARVAPAPKPVTRVAHERREDASLRIDSARVTSALSSNLGWLVAAAAIVLAAIGWLNKPVSAPDHRTAMASLLSETRDVMRIPWAPTNDPAGGSASGEVVWCTSKQKGYMIFRGLAVNDPRVEQYQLWIFDANQDERYPLQGGVFDVPAGQSEVIVPISVPMIVSRPMLFAITREKPGGVWVSDRLRMSLMAKVAG